MLVTIGIVVIGGGHCHCCSWCGGLVACAHVLLCGGGHHVPLIVIIIALECKEEE